MQIALYGTGKNAEYCVELIRKIDGITVKDVYDGNSNLYGKKVYGFCVKSPEELKKNAYDKILIASKFYKEIYTSLKRNGCTCVDKIQKADVFLEKMYYEQHYNTYYEKNKKFLRPMNQNEKLVVYTAIFGDRDELKEPEFIDERVVYICYTDNKNLQSKNWNIILQNRKYKDPVRCAKEYKVLPHRYLQAYEHSIWIDASLRIVGNMLQFYNTESGNRGITVAHHPIRNCVFEEGKICTQELKDEPCIIEKQLNYYKKIDYPTDNGLIAGGVILRQHMESESINIMEKWWEEIENWSRRDQLSFNYVCWKNKFVYDMLGRSIFEKQHPYIQYEGHK